MKILRQETGVVLRKGLGVGLGHGLPRALTFLPYHLGRGTMDAS